MRAHEYDKVVEVFNSFSGADPTQHLVDSFPQYEAAVLCSIAAQEIQKCIKVNYKKFSNTNRVTSFYKRYTAAVERGEGPGILLDMANKNCFSPALLAKLVLERHVAVQDELCAAAAPSGSLPSRNQVSPPSLSVACEGNTSPTEGSPTDDALSLVLVPSTPILNVSSAVETLAPREANVSTSVVLGNIIEDLEENNDAPRFVESVEENFGSHGHKINSSNLQGDAAGVLRPELVDHESSSVSSPDDEGLNSVCKKNEEMVTTLLGALNNVFEEAARKDLSGAGPVTSSHTCERESKEAKCSSRNESQILMLSDNEAAQSRKKKSATANKSRINKLLRDTALIPDKVLSFEVHLCLVNDDVYGPFADTIKHSIGHEYEELLKRKLRERSISYQTEEDLRSLGCDKTPDTRLHVPIGVGGRVVNWIESKASFGDRENHRAYLSDQLWSYWNRFGPGLVIYWFGFIDELNYLEDKGIIVRDCFPEDIVTMDPLAVKSASLCAA